MKTLKGLVLTLIATFTLAGCGGGGDSGGTTYTQTPPVVSAAPSISAFNVVCQCGSCLASIVAQGGAPITYYSASLNQANAPALNSTDWSPTGTPTSITFSGSYTVRVPALTCTARSNAQICAFVRDNQERIAAQCTTAQIYSN